MKAIHDEVKKNGERLEAIADGVGALVQIVAGLAESYLSRTGSLPTDVLPFDEDGTCSACDGAKVQAKGDRRDCKNCQRAWRVLTRENELEYVRSKVGDDVIIYLGSDGPARAASTGPRSNTKVFPLLEGRVVVAVPR